MIGIKLLMDLLKMETFFYRSSLIYLRFLVSKVPITCTLHLKVIYSCSNPGKVLLTVLVRFQLCLWLHLGKCTDSQSYCQILTRYEAFRRRYNQSTNLSTPEIALLLIQLFKVSILASAEFNVFNFKPWYNLMFSNLPKTSILAVLGLPTSLATKKQLIRRKFMKARKTGF